MAGSCALASSIVLVCSVAADVLRRLEFESRVGDAEAKIKLVQKLRELAQLDGKRFALCTFPAICYDSCGIALSKFCREVLSKRCASSMMGGRRMYKLPRLMH